MNKRAGMVKPWKTHGSPKITRQKFVSAFSTSESGNPIPIRIAIRLPVFTDKFVIIPNDPNS